jgi:hypothetical protein
MNLLLVVSRYPWPPRRGDQLRAAQWLELLAPEHRVTLLAPEPPRGAPEPPTDGPVDCRVELYRPASVLDRGFAVSRRLVTGEPLQNGLFQPPGLVQRLRRLAPQADLVVLQLARLAGLEQFLGETPWAVDFIDSLSLNLERRAAFDVPWLRPVLRFEARRLATAERRLLRFATGALVVCPRDREALVQLLGEESTEEAAGGLAARGPDVLPLAFPLRAKVQPSTTEPAADFEEAVGPTSPTVCMTGNLGYFPAVDGFGWWLDEVLPLLRRRIPRVRVVLAGARPAARLRRQARAAGAELIGSPPDLGAIVRSAHVALAPMRCGSGQPLKILEAWQAGKPVVASPWAAAGTTSRWLKDSGSPGGSQEQPDARLSRDSGQAGPLAGREGMRVAETPEQWTDAVAELLEDGAARDRLAAQGRGVLARDYGRESLAVALERWLEACASGKPKS